MLTPRVPLLLYSRIRGGDFTIRLLFIELQKVIVTRFAEVTVTSWDRNDHQYIYPV
jgi:hypothetical protein